jgi:cell division protein FtsI (penicillin-binding protein 3)
MPAPSIADAPREDRIAMQRNRGRFAIAAAAFAFAFVLIGGRLVTLGVLKPADLGIAGLHDLGTSIHRPDIVDRHGRLLATDIRSASLYADPGRVIDLDELIEQVSTVLPKIDRKGLRAKIENGRRFVWVQRELSPKQQAEIHELGVPGLGFVEEHRRVYPAGNVASHVLGHVDIDNHGLAGIEKYIDRNPHLTLGAEKTKAERPQVKLSLDLGAQHAVRDELRKAMTEFEAKAAAAIVMDVKSGEIVAMASLPDYNPNRREEALHQDRYNRVMAGVFELGSIFKIFTTAAALDEGVVGLQGGYDATHPIRVGRHSISDFHPKRRWLSVPEIFIYSSNIGTAKMAVDLGVDRHREFLRRIGFLGRISCELGDTAFPIVPADWKPINTMTISYGHGISITPLQMAAGASILMNGGYGVQPTLLMRSREEAMAEAPKLISGATSDVMRRLMRLNVEQGTAKKSDAVGYRVGGKTGTAEKVENGRYSHSALLTSFVGVFPSDAPEYVVLTILDEPQRMKHTHGFATAGWNAAPVTRRIVERIAPLLGIAPKFESPDINDPNNLLVSFR